MDKLTVANELHILGKRILQDVNSLELRRGLVKVESMLVKEMRNHGQPLKQNKFDRINEIALDLKKGKILSI